MMSAESAIFCYDANGNMMHKIDGSTTSYAYDAENRMTAVSGAAVATFVYDGDGNRVKGVVGGVTTTCIDNYFESCQGRSLLFTHNPN
jgi:YD repeat-containing protein